MANASQDKTEEPTDKKIEDSLKEGQVARSKDLSGALTLLIAMGLFMAAFPILSEHVLTYAKDSWSFDQATIKDTGQFSESIKNGLRLLISGALFISLPTFVIMLLLGAFPGRIVFLMKNAHVKPSRLNPISGLKRMVGKESLVELVKSILKVFLVAGLVYWIMLGVISETQVKGGVLFYAALSVWLPKIIYLAFLIVLVFFIVALFDAWYQRHSHFSKLKMTKQEVKDERKNSDGNPEVKSRIRSLQREMAAQRLSERVPQSDVIITNPTHFSVAIHYDESVSQAPYVIAKGVDHLAAQIKLLAGAHQVQIVESPSLARAIYYTTQVDQEIPSKLYKPVAQILSYVAQCKAYENGVGEPPQSPPNIHISGY